MIYVRSVNAKNYNDRTVWYRNNLGTIKKTLTISTYLVISFLVFLFFKNFHTLLSLSAAQFLLLAAFPLVAAWYTFSPRIFQIKKIRQVGWIKPFIVGLTWAGWVTVYPTVIGQVQHSEQLHEPVLPFVLLWLENFLFFSVNAIIFDIKDYRNDFKYQLKTYPVILGIKKTFSHIIIPVTILNFIVFFLFHWQQKFSMVQTFIQLIPYLLLVWIIVNHRQQRSVLYYLVAVDGLVFAKAVCGITSILFFKK
jgi:4-hydroxybenzoate polyprenyltransferase